MEVLQTSILLILYPTFYERTVSYDYQYPQAEISVHVGPSVTFQPARKLAIQAYFRFAPTFATLYIGNDKTFYGNNETL